MTKRGQVTLFILLAIVIVAGIMVYFLWVEPNYISESSKRVGFEGCIQDAMELKIEELGLKGGVNNPTFTYPYQGEEYTYYCYSEGYYDLCTVQIPFPEARFKKELQLILREDVDNCYSDSINDLLAQGYDVKPGKVDYEVFLESGLVRMELNAPTSVGSQTFSKFNVKLSSNIYDMLIIATSLLQFESTLGDTDLNEISFYYPEYKITKNEMGQGTKLYLVQSKIFGNKLRFASRSLVLPAGYI